MAGIADEANLSLSNFLLQFSHLYSTNAQQDDIGLKVNLAKDRHLPNLQTTMNL